MFWSKYELCLFFGCQLYLSLSLAGDEPIFLRGQAIGIVGARDKIFLAEVQRFAHMGVRLVTISRNNMEEILSFLEMADQAGQVPLRLIEMSKAGDTAILRWSC